MSYGLTLHQTPEEEELELKQEELSYLETELAQSELDLVTLQAELQAFEQQYVLTVGVRLAELDAIEKQIVDMLFSRNPDDPHLKEQAARARERANESAQARDNLEEAFEDNKFEPSPEMKQIFRTLAKQVHPDLANDEKELVHRTRLMAEANLAYQRGDLEKLQEIVAKWQSAPESVQGTGIPNELVRVIRKISQIRRRLVTIEDEITFLMDSDLYALNTEVTKAETAGLDLLAEMGNEVEARIMDARERLEHLEYEESGVR